MRPKRWLTVTLVVLVVVAVTGSATRARHRTRVARHAIGELANPDAGLVLSGVLIPVATTPIEAPVSNLDVPLNSYVTKGQIIGEAVLPVSPDQALQNGEPRFSPDEAGSAVARAREDVRRAEADLEAARARETDAAVQQVVSTIAERATEQRHQNAGLQFREGGMSEARYDQAVLAVDSAVVSAGTTRFQAEADTSAVSDATTRLLRPAPGSPRSSGRGNSPCP